MDRDNKYFDIEAQIEYRPRTWRYYVGTLFSSVSELINTIVPSESDHYENIKIIVYN